ncbi:MAG: EamA family transporter [Flavobacteriales bacterium]|nr:EamA family transporter [Flavobacteriales bacterium]
MTRDKLYSLLLLHLIVLIFGFTGIWGKLVSLESAPLVFLRMLIGGSLIGVFLLVSRRKWRLPLNMTLKMALVGLIVAAHWITFFEAIHRSNVSVTLSTMASTSLFVAVLTPIIGGGKLKWYEVWLGVVVIVGLAMIFGFASGFWEGMVLALISAFLAALFTLLNAIFIRHIDSLRITLWEMLFGAGVVAIYLGVVGYSFEDFLHLSGLDWLWVLLLAVLATAFAFVVSVQVMKVLSPFTVAISVNLEPIYSIILALMIFGEEERMSWGFYMGSALILVAILANAFFKKKEAAYAK